MGVYVYASLCDFVCIALLLPFVLGFSLSFFFYYSFSALIIGGFVFWFGCSLLSFFLSFFFLYYVLIFLFLIIIFYFNNFILFFSFFLSFFSPFSSEPCG